jgi:CBS domain-containing protein
MLSIPVQYIKKNGIGYIIRDDYVNEVKIETETSLLGKLLNQQIVDVDGTEVIRVNDVVISDVPDYTISGIDIGILGVFRWVGGAKLVSRLLAGLNIHYKSDFIPWSEIEDNELAKGRIVLKSEKEKLKKIHPEDLAEHLEHANIRNVLRALRVMDEKMSARVIADLNVDYQREIFQRFSAENAGNILSLIHSDEAADVLLSLDVQKREEILEHIQKGKKQPILHLLAHAKTPIGHLLSTEYLAVPSDFSVKAALDQVKNNTDGFEELLYVYLTNKDNQIVGVVNLHQLILQKPEELLYKIMNQNLVLGRLSTPKEILLRRMIKYDIYAIPIVDEKRSLLGIVSLQDINEDMGEY